MSEPDLVVGAAEANRSFSKLLRAAREGRRVTITSHGEPVAELVPAAQSANGDTKKARRAGAQAELEAHWASLEPAIVGPWTREELHERYDDKNALSALVQEVERTRAEIIITRHGRPAAKLAPVGGPSEQSRAAIIARLGTLRDETARRHPEAEPVPWETLKRWARDEDDES